MITLKKLTETPLEVHLKYIKEWYNIGEQFACAELFRSYNIIKYDNQRNDYEMYSIYIENTYAGVIGFESYSCDPANTWLSWTFIIPQFRGKGWGKQAFNLLIDVLKNKNYENLYIDSVKDNNTQMFYKSLGFNYVGTSGEFRQKYPQYSKEILMYNSHPVYSISLNSLSNS